MKASKKEKRDKTLAKALLRCARGYYYVEEVPMVIRGELQITTVKKYVLPNAWAIGKLLEERKPSKKSEWLRKRNK
jgi:hypothetical protein